MAGFAPGGFAGLRVTNANVGDQRQLTVPPRNAASSDTKPRMDSTIVKGMAVIEALARSPTPLGVTELARAVGLLKSNVHRILGTLVQLGYVQKQQDTARYRLSLKLWETSAKIINRNQLRRVARPFLRQLHQETSEFVYLTVLAGSDIVYLDTMDAVFPLGAGIVPGTRVPIAFPASGKAILAYQADKQRLITSAAASVPKRPLDPAKLLRELAQIRSAGYATSMNGWTAGRNSVAAAVLPETRPPVAAVGIGGPAERMDEDRLRTLSALVRNAATRIAETLGESEVEQVF